jgi:hypothetical protein
MAKETHIKTDKKTRWRLGGLGVTLNDDWLLYHFTWHMVWLPLA